MELIDWQGHLAIFNGNRNTKPVEEIEGDFQDISEKLAPRAGPTVSSDKLSVKYFLGTKLKKSASHWKDTETCRTKRPFPYR